MKWLDLTRKVMFHIQCLLIIKIYFMRKIFELIKIIKVPLIILLLLGLVYFGLILNERKITKNNFLKKYDVLTVVGDSFASYSEVQLNGKIVEENIEGWTNVLPVLNSLDYITLTSSYSKGHEIKCGDTTIPKRIGLLNIGENEWCIKHNNKEIISVYYPLYYDNNNIVYETCLKSSYYESLYGGTGYNTCAEMGLFFNGEQIATTKEQIVTNDITGETSFDRASSFSYLPSKKLGSSIIYSTSDDTFSYDIETKMTYRLSDEKQSKIEDAFMDKNGKLIFVRDQNDFFEDESFGIIEYEGRNYTNVYSADYIDENFYILRIVRDKKKDDSNYGNVNTFELLKNGVKIETFEINGSSLFGYSSFAVRPFPLCDIHTIVCVYEDSHYAYTNMFDRLNPYFKEMIIDGIRYKDHIPNMIGWSKPIFENGKLKYIVYTDNNLDEGLYLVDFDKDWSYESILSQNGSTIKLLDGKQKSLLNVIVK